MGNICEPYCSCNCNCENQKICKDCAEGCGNCLSCEGCHQCTECDPRLMNPCLIRETSSKDLMMVLKEFEFKGENDDKWFGEVHILEHKIQKEIVILKIVESTSEQEAEQVQQSFVRRLKLSHENLVRLRYLVHKEVDAFCSVVFKTYLFFDYILTDLSSELKHRNKKSLYFSEEEIWNMVYCLINGMKYFASISLNHGCINSKNVYITQYGEFKLADPGLFNYEVSYDAVFANRDLNPKGIILSPAQIHGLERNIETPIHDSQKSDVFCLGMVLLEAATLTSSDSCFDFYHSWVLEDRIADRLNDVKLKYHDSLYFLIKDMLTMNELQRPDFTSIYDKSSRNPRFRATHSNTYQQQAQLQLQNVAAGDISDTASALNNSMTYTAKPAGGANAFQQPSHNLIVSKPFLADNMSMVDGGHNDNVPVFGAASHITPGVFDLPAASQYNISSNNNLLGQYSMPAPVMGFSSIGGIYPSGGGGGFGTGQSSMLTTTARVAGREKIQESYKNGSRYEGEVRNGVRDGKGKYYYNNGGYYEGQWRDGKMTGQGTLYFPNGSTAYDGNWRDDQFHGYGTLYNNTVESESRALDYKNLSDIRERWLKYEGDFKHDLKDGFGTFFFSNGERFVGGFKSDKIHGQGTYYLANNQIVKGRWTNNFMS